MIPYWFFFLFIRPIQGTSTDKIIYVINTIENVFHARADRSSQCINSYEKTPTFFYYNMILNIRETQSLRNLSYTIFILQYLQILPQVSRTYRWMMLVCDAFAKPLVSVNQAQSVREKYAVCTV